MDCLTRQEAASELRVSLSTVIRLQNQGILGRYEPIPGRVYIPRADVAEYKRTHTTRERKPGWKRETPRKRAKA